MIENLITIIRTLFKGVIQGTSQFITNDLPTYIPYFIAAGVIVIIHFAIDFFKNRHK